MNKRNVWSLPAEEEQRLADDISNFVTDPRSYARYCFPWGEEGTDLEDSYGPKQWQDQIFKDVTDALNDPVKRNQPIMIAVASGHGIGKSAFISMVSKWALDTCVDTKIVLTSNTETQLRTKTFPELKKWFRLSLTSH